MHKIAFIVNSDVWAMDFHIFNFTWLEIRFFRGSEQGGWGPRLVDPNTKRDALGARVALKRKGEPDLWRLPHGRQLLLDQRPPDPTYDEAIPLFSRLLSSRPDSSLLYNRPGECYRGLNQPDSARRAFEEAYEINSDDAAALARPGESALAEQRFQDAADLLSSALEKQPGANRLHHPLGLLKLNTSALYWKKFDRATVWCYTMISAVVFKPITY